MKCLLITILAAALAFMAGAQADYFRVFYYIEKEDGAVYGPDGKIEHLAEQPLGRPYKYSTQAKTECGAYCELIQNSPNAVYVTINNLGPE
jgi:hypothetical protein